VRGAGWVAAAATALCAGAAPGCAFDARSRGDLFSAGLALEKSGDWALAEAMFQKILDAHPDDADAWKRLGECAAALGDTDGATAAYLHYVALRPAALADVSERLTRLGVDPAVLKNRAGVAAEPPGPAHVRLSGKLPPPELLGAAAPRGTYYPGGGKAPGGVLGAILPTRLDRGAVAVPGGKGPVWALAIDPRGTRVAHGLPGGGLRIVEYGAPSGAGIVLEGGGGPALAAAFAGEADRLVWGTAGGKVFVNGARGEPVAELGGHAGAVRAVAIDADAERVYSAGADAVVRVWKVDGARLERAIALPAPATALGLSPGSRYLAVALEDGRVLVLDPLSAALEETLRDHRVHASGAAFTADGAYLVTGAWDGTARVYRAGTWESAGVHPMHPDVITSVAAGARVAVTASADCRVKVWEAHTGLELLQLPGHTAEVEAVATSVDGRHVVSVDYTGELRFWDLR